MKAVRLIAIGAVAVLCLALPWVLRGEADDGPPARVHVEGSAMFPDEALEDWKSYADHVAVVTVTDAQQSALDAEQISTGEGYVPRIVTYDIDSVLWSAPDAPSLPAEIELASIGWVLHDSVLAIADTDDAPRAQIGEQYVMALVQVELDAGPEWWPLTSGSLLPLDDDEVEEPTWDNATAEALVGETVDDVEDLVEEQDPDPIAEEYEDLRPQDRIDAVEREEEGLGTTQHIDHLWADLDCWLREYPPGDRCSETELWVGADVSARNNSLLQFDVSGIPSTAEIFEAKLRVFVVDDQESGKTISALPVTTDWNGGVDWLDSGNGSWTTYGGDFGDASDIMDPAGFEGSWLEFDVTPIVAGWVSGSAPDYGIGLSDESANLNNPDTAIVFSASEGDNPPELKIGWAP